MKKRITEFFSNNFLIIIVGVAIGLSIGTFICYDSQGLTLVHGDARARLNIARRVIDSLTPGLAQLGNIWPPFPHLLYLTTIWNDFMYYSGFSGSIVSMVSYVITIVILSKLLFETTKDKGATAIGILLVLLNPSFLFMQTTPMTESLFIGLLTLSSFLIWRWYKSQNVLYLIGTAIVVFCATLTRYDGWFLAVAIATVVGVIAFLRSGYKMMEGYLLLYATPAFLGMAGWLLYQLIIYGNPLAFALGEGSGSFFSKLAGASGLAYVKYNVMNSFLTYFWASMDNVGLLAVFIIILSLIYLILTPKKISVFITIVILGSPVIFNIISLFLGQSVIFTEHLPPFGLYNLRYGLLSLPLFAYLIGWLASENKVIKFVLLILIILQTGILLQSKPITLVDALRSSESSAGIDQKELSHWLRNHPTQDLTLLSVLANDALVFDAHIKNSRLIYEGSGKVWHKSLEDPSSSAGRIIISPDNVLDTVWKASQENSKFFDGFNLVFKGKNFRVYDLAKNTKTETVKELPLEITEPVEKLPIETSCDYTIQVGDSLWRIAKKKLGKGSYFTKIIELNKDTYFDLPIIHPGKKIAIPCT